ncbi:MFS transporter [Kitasatospora purpeofusca]|uniref:MFS transporter n=1 Tax=Kitasatospora purpeofusca TaxID=67352 RepID=UPI00224D394C|nr:MFS transporter [Kitasatospora purpeofusca]MCX4756793.1 MFS transporter [Kitasatospora purpeofusca]WSR35424.1 MFS transporter [Kitasatospora purpeofusca]WSR43744.1 MFS transporter [Kitasatospora purpeofusca]
MTVDALPRPSEHDTAAPDGLGRRQVHAVAACYFVASFAALGLPPYLTAILPGLGDQQGRWAGVLYIVPTVFSALGAPMWGRLADRYGRKRLLLRAQLGLALSFLLAGAADSLTAFTLALVLQGFLGGTFAATNGYLAAALDGARLSRALTLMQGSARAALVAAPILVGVLSPWIDPHRQYLLMAVLPLTAAVFLSLLPEPGRPGAKATAESAAEAGTASEPDPALGPGPGSATAAAAPTDATADEPTGRTPLRVLYGLEFAFVFATIISFPYLISLAEERLPGVSGTTTGVLFALPHLCYLAFAARTHTAFLHRPHTGIALGFGFVALGLAGHAVADSLPAFVAVRLLLGAGLTLGLVCLSVLAAEACRGRAPGRLFGSLEFVSKGGAVAAGAVAALVNGRFGATSPVLVGTAAALLAAVAATALSSHSRQRWSRT